MTTVNFLYLPKHNTEVVHVLNGLPCIIANELGIEPVDFITLSGMDRSTFGTWYPSQRLFTDPIYLYNKETMTEILQGTDITAEDLENDPEAIRTKKLTTFNDSYFTKVYARGNVHDDETATYSSISKQVGSKLQTP